MQAIAYQFLWKQLSSADEKGSESKLALRDVAAVLYGLPFVYVGVMHFVQIPNSL